LVVAVLVVGGFAWVQANSADNSTNPSTASTGDDFDAVLDDPQAVVTYPTDGLTNGEVTGDPFPAAVFLDRADNEITSAELIGEPMVVNLWYSTCAPCAKELPDFAEVDGEVDDIRFVGVNTLDSVDEMERFAGERGVEYELLRDRYAELVDGIGAVAFPITLFVTSDGTIVEQTGALDADELRGKVADLLAADEASA
jgi:thiol-disulfide isomerase/thioredoxin